MCKHVFTFLNKGDRIIHMSSIAQVSIYKHMGDNKRRYQVLPIMHLLPMGFLYRWSCRAIVMKFT